MNGSDQNGDSDKKDKKHKKHKSRHHDKFVSSFAHFSRKF